MSPERHLRTTPPRPSLPRLAPVYDSRQLVNSRSTRETPHGPDRISGTQLRLLRNADRLGDRNLAGAPAMDRAYWSGYRAGVTAGSVRRRRDDHRDPAAGSPLPARPR